jgi:galactokinase
MPDAAAHHSFHARFGGTPDVAAEAPGRVNLIGEHTDYHEGFVLPTVIPQRTTVHLRRRDDRLVHAWSSLGGEVVEYELGAETRRQQWIDYVQGVTAVLARSGVRVPGFDLHVESTIPAGAGVSSSAALEISVLRALRQLAGLALDDVAIARLAQAAETDFVGAPVGIMDQMACSVGRDREALFLDTRTLAFERVALPETAELIVIDSGVTHSHAAGEYRTRREESFAAAARLGVHVLRDVGIDALPRVAQLPPVLCRRARHVITENQRVYDAVAALRRGDLPALGSLLNASHVSMRDDYEISTPDIDALVAIGQSHADVYGARMTGGGFGGAVVMLARAGRGMAVARAVGHRYDEAAGRRAQVLVPAA